MESKFLKHALGKNRVDNSAQQNPESRKSRRSFLNILLGGSLTAFIASVLYPAFRFLTPPGDIGEPVTTSVMAGSVVELKPDSGKIIKFGRQPVILIRTDSGDIRAFSAICTHLDCIVQYRSDFKHIWCACHNGHYNLNGVNIAGPPPRPLAPFKVNIKEDKIFVSKEA
ncbi:MAG: Rieske 2Fe-2S domain-containing protein [Calditrichaceae bacterium]|nr:Rieske 2Fe-2S domain-containing protein [Calditrichia bacterium]NUQ40662.1 Rieske 2Fe-2S domain-containing protein [Calditrichaceae bacterium]